MALGLVGAMNESAVESLTEFYDLREALETHAVAAGKGGWTEDRWRQMRTSNDEMSRIAAQARQHGWLQEYRNRWLLADASFHLSLLRSAGNQSTLRLANDWQLMPTVFEWRHGYVSKANHDRIYGEHEQIISAIARGEIARGQELIARHLRAGLQIALASLGVSGRTRPLIRDEGW